MRRRTVAHGISLISIEALTSLTGSSYLANAEPSVAEPSVAVPPPFSHTPEDIAERLGLEANVATQAFAHHREVRADLAALVAGDKAAAIPPTD